MNKQIAIGTTAFAALSSVLGVAVQAGLEFLGVSSSLAGQAGFLLIAMPLALVLSRRVGRVTHLSVLVACVALTVIAYWAVVVILNAIAEPAGGHVGWSNLLNAMNWRSTVLGTAAMLIVPQGWLLLLNRMAANNSSKPTPLRGAA